MKTRDEGVVKEIDSLSPYGKFHLTYLGYDFKRISSGKVYAKGEFWDHFNDLAKGLHLDKRNPKAPLGFTLHPRQVD
jgi:hypothetical protein